MAQFPEEIYLVFLRQIQSETVANLVASLAVATQNQVKHVHLAFHSFGGSIADGIALYSTFQAYPIDLTIYNVGTVSSIAAVAFLGAPRRIVSSYGSFMIHRSTLTAQANTAASLEGSLKSLEIDDRRTESILRSHLHIDESLWKQLNASDLTFDADASVEAGFAHEIAQFCPPKGSALYSI